jgi:hypothetical protein
MDATDRLWYYQIQFHGDAPLPTGNMKSEWTPPLWNAMLIINPDVASKVFAFNEPVTRNGSGRRLLISLSAASECIQ